VAATKHQAATDTAAAIQARPGVAIPLMEDITVMVRSQMPKSRWTAPPRREFMHPGNSVMKGYLRPRRHDMRRGAGISFRLSVGATPQIGPHADCGPRQGHHLFRASEITFLPRVEALMGHPDVNLAAVVAQPDDKWGEVPWPGYSRLKPGATQRTGSQHDRLCPPKPLQGSNRPKRVILSGAAQKPRRKVQKFELPPRAAKS